MEELKDGQADVRELQQKLLQRHKKLLIERDMSTNKQILICGYVEKLNKSEEEIKTLQQDLEQSRTQAEDAERELLDTSQKLRRQ